MTQAAWAVASASSDSTALYVSGEESGEQIRLRAERLGSLSDNLLILNETNVHAILHQIESFAPAVVVVDSIQTTYDPGLDSAPGNVSQLRECAAALTRLAKQRGIPLFLIGHVTKEGSIAGPRILEHMVDAVLYFEGDRHHAYRILRAVKNRFGSTDEIGIFEMRESGLCEVENPSGALLAERSLHSTGSAVAATLEGSRALLVEVQALVSRSFLASPRRTANGIDVNRVHMLLAGMEKRAGLRLGEQDVFLNVVGGVRVVEPATDLAVTMAVASSFRDQAVDPEAVLIGEVGLGGEIRAVSQLEKRLKEASRLGFSRALIPKYGAPKSVTGIKLCPVATLQEAIGQCLKPV
jgi:DNA repair protein RadA/Sms